MLEETVWHFFVEVTQVRLDLALHILNYFYYVFGVLTHVLSKSEFLLHCSPLVELHVS